MKNLNGNFILFISKKRVNIAIMRTEQYNSNTLEKFFRRKNMATLNELRTILGHASERTVFRKLSELESINSYSHRGQYYTLKSLTSFDENGLWTCRGVWFSRFGNLLNTVQALVEYSPEGFSARELSDVLHVECKHALVESVRRKQLKREKLHGSYIYFALQTAVHTRQQHRRKSLRNLPPLLVSNPELAVEEAKAAILLFMSSLTEQQRRLYAGLESLKLGHGGDEHIATLFGIDRHTVARGREELLQETAPIKGVRRSGGGRPCVEKKRPKS